MLCTIEIIPHSSRSMPAFILTHSSQSLVVLSKNYWSVCYKVIISWWSLCIHTCSFWDSILQKFISKTRFRWWLELSPDKIADKKCNTLCHTPPIMQTACAVKDLTCFIFFAFSKIQACQEVYSVFHQHLLFTWHNYMRGEGVAR